MNGIRRIFVEKKVSFCSFEVESLLKDLQENLGVRGITGLRLVKRYDVEGLTEDEYGLARRTIFSEPPVDMAYDEEVPLSAGERVIAVEYLPGQYDQRADSAAQCIEIITRKQKPAITTAQLYILNGNINDKDWRTIKKYLINPVDSREASLNKRVCLDMKYTLPANVKPVKGFIDYSTEQLQQFRLEQGLAMSQPDLEYCQDYFKNREKRDPYITEIKVLDTYWSDHCRHSTFHARINRVEFGGGTLVEPIKQAYKQFLKATSDFNPEKDGDMDLCLMNLATMSMKELRRQGKLEDLEISGENNACSIVREIEVDGKKEEWLIMFKNETHNHPTEIEPFGGAATCLGGAIRDPLSGRAFVYQAMRVTGSGNPLKRIEETLPGKLPQRKITTEAAHGYSCYGNQIGLPTGKVTEIYHEGYVAKRMEVGAVIGAVAKKNVRREKPSAGDVILLVGGRTGRDGIGGATGSSREHTEESLYTASAEVQKGNPPEERKLQRLFRNREVCHLIKRCNDFGAGGVAVAIGELAEGLEINLDLIPKKYEGLDGTELALSESQERMAVVVCKENAELFKALADSENLEATIIAIVTGDKRLKMYWRNSAIVNLCREFIDTHGIRQETNIYVTTPNNQDFFSGVALPIQTYLSQSNIASAWLENAGDINHCSQKGLGERFDSSVGCGTVLMPFGGKFQETPIEAMGARVPVLTGETSAATLMSFGFNPDLSSWSPFHGGVYSLIEAVAKIVAAGGEYSSIRTSLQEYFEKPGQEPGRWGKPFSALLGAYHAHSQLGIPAIGGKDSMSGSFKDLDVPPTLITFAVNTTDAGLIISPEFKKVGSAVIYLPLPRDKYHLPCFDVFKSHCEVIYNLICQGKILAARSIRRGGIALAISEMGFGNGIGFQFSKKTGLPARQLFTPEYGSFLLEIDHSPNMEQLFKGLDYIFLGCTIEDNLVKFAEMTLSLNEIHQTWEQTLEPIFPTRLPHHPTLPITSRGFNTLEPKLYHCRSQHHPARHYAKPRVLITVFPGTNCEYETQQGFEKAGAITDIFVFRNQTTSHIEQSLEQLKNRINQAQVVMIPGGFSAGDEPDGSGKFIAAVFRNPDVKEAILDLLHNRDGLILGICNGFQALIKLGLVPYGDIRDLNEHAPTLTFNRIGRLVSGMVRTQITSVLSPWFLLQEAGGQFIIPSSHGEGRFIADEDVVKALFKNGQVATQYIDMTGRPTEEMPYNPNGSVYGVEGLTSPDGRVLGKMAHTERLGPYVAKNIPGLSDQKLLASGVAYFQ